MSDDKLDFTHMPEVPVPAPEKVESAREEARTGSPELVKSGFYVAMARHSAGRVAPRNVSALSTNAPSTNS